MQFAVDACVIFTLGQDDSNWLAWPNVKITGKAKRRLSSCKFWKILLTQSLRKSHMWKCLSRTASCRHSQTNGQKPLDYTDSLEFSTSANRARSKQSLRKLFQLHTLLRRQTNIKVKKNKMPHVFWTSAQTSQYLLTSDLQTDHMFLPCYMFCFRSPMAAYHAISPENRSFWLTTLTSLINQSLA